MFLNWLYLIHCLTSFSSINHLLCLYTTSSNIDEVLSVNPSANVFVFGDFNAHHKDWLNYSGKTERPVNFVIIFLSQMVNADGYSDG